MNHQKIHNNKQIAQPHKIIAIALSLVLLFSFVPHNAFATQTPEPTPEVSTVVPTPEPTPDVSTATPTPVATPDVSTATPTPEATPDASTATPTPVVTPEASTATPTPEATPDASTATPTPEVEISKQDDSLLDSATKFSLPSVAALQESEESATIIVKYLKMAADGKYDTAWGFTSDEPINGITLFEHLYTNSDGQSNLTAGSYDITPQELPAPYKLVSGQETQTETVNAGDTLTVYFKAQEITYGSINVTYLLSDAEGNYLDNNNNTTTDISNAAIISNEAYSDNTHGTNLPLGSYSIAPNAPVGFNLYDTSAQSITLTDESINATATFRVVAKNNTLYTATYYSNDADNDDSQTHVYASGSQVSEQLFPNPLGKTFSHWTTDKEGNGQSFNANDTLPNNNIDLYAQYTINQYSVTYVTNYPLTSGLAELTKTDNNNNQYYTHYGEGFSAFELATVQEFTFDIPTGKRFVTWDYNRYFQSTGAKKPNSTIEMTNDAVLYAIWDDAYNMTATATPYTETYDGQSHDILEALSYTKDPKASAALDSTSATTEYSLDGGKTFTTTMPQIKDVGTYDITIRITAKDYNPYTINTTAEIYAAPLVVVADDKDVQIGELFDLSYSFETGSEPVASEEADVIDKLGSAADLFEIDNYIVDTEDTFNIIAKTDNPTTDATNVLKNYNISYKNGTLTVDKITSLVINAKDYTETYDGTNHSTKLNISTNVTNNITVKYTINGTVYTELPEFVNADTYTITITATDTNEATAYPQATKTITVTINKRTASIGVGTYTKYQNSADPKFTPILNNILTDDISSLGITITRPSGEALTSYVLTPSFTVNNNYEITTTSGSLTINAVPPATPTPVPATPVPATPTPTPTAVAPVVTPTPTVSPSAEPTPTVTATPEASTVPEATATPEPTPETGGITLPEIDGGNGGTPSLPENVQVDGQDLSDQDYTITDDGKIELSPEFLQTLPDGEHTIRIEVDGEIYESTIIMEGGVPLSSGAFEKVAASWSLVNLILTILVALFAIIYIVFKSKKEKDENEEEYEDENQRKKRKNASIVLVILSIVSIILLLITQDFTQPMVMLDKYSIIFAIITLLQAFIALVFKKKTRYQPNDK